MTLLLDGLAPGDAVRYIQDDGEHMDGIVLGFRDGLRQLGAPPPPGCDEDCVVVEFLVVEAAIESVILACAAEQLVAMRDAELREFLLANLAALPVNAGAPTRA